MIPLFERKPQMAFPAVHRERRLGEPAYRQGHFLAIHESQNRPEFSC